MRIAKVCLMFSLSAFLTGVAWSVIAPRIGEVGSANAQSGGTFVAIQQVFDTSGHGKNSWVAVTAAGDVYKVSLGHEPNNIPTPSEFGVLFVGSIQGGVVPTSSSSLSDLKQRFKNNEE